MRKIKRILVTGCAGFVGQRVSYMLLKQKKEVIGIDNMNDYYDVRIKKYRLNQLKKLKGFSFYKADIENINSLKKIMKSHRIDAVIHLAARAGVRYSLENPFVYQSTNSLGTLNLLEVCRANKISKFVLASTSSLYAGQKMPFKETLAVNQPISPYAASKKAAEAMAHAYHYLYQLDVSIIRFFTVYGPAGRPDMSIFRFIKWIDENKSIELFGDGSQRRDFTYIDDIARGAILSLKLKGYQIINLGGNRVVSLNWIIKFLEKYLNKKAKKHYRKFHKADIVKTFADTSVAAKTLNWHPKVSLEQGLKNCVEWYQDNKSLMSKINL